MYQMYQSIPSLTMPPPRRPLEINPSYTNLFRTHALYQEGGGGVSQPLYNPINPLLHKRQILYGIRDTPKESQKIKVY